MVNYVLAMAQRLVFYWAWLGYLPFPLSRRRHFKPEAPKSRRQRSDKNFGPSDLRVNFIFQHEDTKERRLFINIPFVPS